MGSLWERTARLPAFPPLRGDKRVDVLIIGGGPAGVLTAYRLQQAGVDYALVEQHRIGRGVTGGTTAKITAQHGLIYHRLLKSLGEERAKAYLTANLQAVEDYAALCADIPCGFVRQDNTVYVCEDGRKIENELAALERLGYDAVCPKETAVLFETAGAVTFPRQAQFHPLRFLGGIAADLHIYERTAVRQLVGTTAVTDRGRIHAQRVVVATHFPFINKHGSYFLKMYQHRSYLLALEGASLPDGMLVDDDKKGLSFRRAGKLLLLGGGGHRTGKQGGSYHELRQAAARYYPDATERAHWAAQDCMTLDGLPYVGRYAATTPRLYVATGFNKWGMTGSMVAANLLRDMLVGKENPLQSLLSPSRSIFKPQLLVNGFEAAAGYLSPTARRCPHLGCALKWNSAEYSWDCPCHGSRFDRRGGLLDNPATGNLHNKKDGHLG